MVNFNNSNRHSSVLLPPMQNLRQWRTLWLHFMHSWPQAEPAHQELPSHRRSKHLCTHRNRHHHFTPHHPHHLIMIILGYGVYRNIFENIQMLSLISWGYGSQMGANQLVIINLGIAKNNNFLSSYGAQFFFALTTIGIFIILVSAVDRLPHNAVATLIKRKKIIFPLRIESLMFNMIMFTSLA